MFVVFSSNCSNVPPLRHAEASIQCSAACPDDHKLPIRLHFLVASRRKAIHRLVTGLNAAHLGTPKSKVVLALGATMEVVVLYPALTITTVVDVVVVKTVTRCLDLVTISGPLAVLFKTAIGAICVVGI